MSAFPSFRHVAELTVLVDNTERLELLDTLLRLDVTDQKTSRGEEGVLSKI